MKFILEILPPKGYSLLFSWFDKAVALGCFADTQAPNVFWEKLYVLRFGWPPLAVVECFRDREEYEGM